MKRKTHNFLNRNVSFKPAGIMVSVFVLLFLSLFVQAAGTESNVSRFTLDNGLQVIIIRNHLAPVVTTIMNYLAGSNEAPKGFPGMAHAQEHMMFRGNPGLTEGQLANIMATMGGRFNADTQQTVTQYYFTVPVEDLDVALHIEQIRMSGILDTDKLWDKERGAIEQEVGQDYSMPEFVFYTKLLAALFNGTPYEHSPLGTVESFNQTTGTMLKEFYDKWYAPNNAILVIVGDVEPQEVIDQVKQMFGPIPRKKLPEKPAVSLEPVQSQTIELKTDQPYGMAIISFRMPGYDSNDYAASEVLSDVLSSQRGTFYSLVPQGKALLAEFSLETLPQTGLGYAAAAFPYGADPNLLISEMRKILADNLKNGFSPDLIEAAKRQEIMSNELQKNSVQQLAMAWSQAVAIEGRTSPEQDIEAIKQVTPEDVNRVANKYLKFNDAVVAILTPEPSGQATAAKPLQTKESFTPEHVTEVELPPWAAKALERLSIPKSTLNPVSTTLPNGLLLIVQPETISKVVTITGHIRNRPELEAPVGKEGVDQVLEQLFEYGSTSLNRLAFQAALDEIGATETAGTDFSLNVLSDKFDIGALVFLQITSFILLCLKKHLKLFRNR